MFTRLQMEKQVKHLPVIDVIIKFGGSSITNKHTLESLKTNELQIASLHIKKCQEAGLTCLVVHGAGSFGHHQAKEYKVNNGLSMCGDAADRHTMWGYVLTRQSVTKLNKLVVGSLIQNKVFAIGCSPGSSWRTESRAPIQWQASEIANLLNMNLVPVFHGDCCLDEKLGCCILSGDTIIQTICSQFEVKRVVFLTDVSGVYDRPPDQTGAKLLKTIAVNTDGCLMSTVEMGDSSQFDVTGGIRLKLKTATDIITSSRTPCPVYVCGVNSVEAEILCLRGRLEDEDLNATEISMTEDVLVK